MIGLADSEKPDHRFPKTVRLLKAYEFAQVHSENCFAADHTLVIKALPNQLGRTRLGLSVSRRVGNAVVRNRWKRLIRESFRRQRQDLPSGLDLIVRPRKGAVCDYHNVCQSLKSLVEKLDRRLKKRTGISK